MHTQEGTCFKFPEQLNDPATRVQVSPSSSRVLSSWLLLNICPVSKSAHGLVWNSVVQNLNATRSPSNRQGHKCSCEAVQRCQFQSWDLGNRYGQVWEGGCSLWMSNFRLHSSDLSRAPQRKLKILEAKDDHTLKHVDAIRGRVTFQQNCNPPSRAVHLRGILWRLFRKRNYLLKQQKRDVGCSPKNRRRPWAGRRGLGW